MAELPHSVGRHFQVEACIGSGATSHVLHVIDQRSGQHLALKQALSPASERHGLFRQEFHVLSRTVHPNVVRAYEYGFADDRPFYTMELLRGRALSELAPLSWQRLCCVLLDLCSPLSMLHARRFVHCDVTARNVLVTERGDTKLIDFGALTATDRPVLTIVGTPPHMAPELVRRQAIDGRVDMFAIGALAYNMLTGQHAYPAHTIEELPQAWTIAPPSVRERGFAIPAALDELIMSLLSLDASARPLQLAEIVHRLSALVDTTYALDAASLQAQLATPSLVGRQHVLERFRAAQRAAFAGRGALLCFSGEKGMGRSRMLESCALEAIHAGAFVIHVVPEQAPRVAYGLFAQILIAAHAQEAKVADALPSVISAALQDVSDGGEQLAHTLALQPETSLHACWRGLCSKRAAVVLLDDLTCADGASMRHCLGLSELVAALPLLIAAAIGTGADVTDLIAAGHGVALGPLNELETAELLRSMFGEPAQLEALSAWVCRAASGVPGACVELARHAVEQGYVRFVAGQFEVSDEISSGRAALPEALDATVLSVRAREALAALSLVTPFGALSESEQAALLGSAGWSHEDALDVLDELRDAQLIVLGVRGYELKLRSVALLDEAQRRAWHERLARLYEQRGHAGGMLSVLHYDYAGETAHACQSLLAMDAQPHGPEDLNGSELGIALHERMLRYAIESGAPRLVVMHCRRVLLRIGATSDARVLIEQLRDDAGLSFWDGCDPELSERARLEQCIARAHARFALSPAAERLPPREAIRQLAETVATAMSICEAAFDAETAATLVQQFRPLSLLNDLLLLTYRLLEARSLSLSHGGLLIERWHALLASFRERPEGLPELHYHLGRELAQLGDPRALEHAEVLPGHQACSVRLLYALAYGDHEAASKQRAIASRYIAEIELLDACGDVLELQHTAAWFEAKATHFAGFRPFASYARALCLLQTGQVAEADQLVALQVHEVPALSHAAWALLRALRAELALLQGEPRLAQELALDLLRLAADAGIDNRAHTRPRRVLALACAALGEFAEAYAALEPWAEAFAAGSTVHAGQLQETYARVALAAGDRALCAAHCERARAIYSRTAHPGLLARLQRLTRSVG